ncbi:Glycosyl hydrolases family 43 [Paenibacillus sp. UNCCL117]|uniref:family 43 glycosylhydrolase n=1 Tax=unclassified Paenibacillus TaxID=185978 RepID=UPI00088F83A6|nr:MULTISPECIES: family 43 glycosylhydrolase [unclassified Paenibacillus]SDD07608.1 Glycosyl hydrolases family 43 [Paenibacillus sp. cl123]SFW31422.1 Glycosyl hydrolases family 43 [Paenibacillus sp. UNCCL117]
MNSSFIHQPPHPETEWSACTGYSESAARIEPLLDVSLQDASICAGPEGMYYLTGTTSGADVQVWASPDLKAWTGPVSVWRLETEGTWQKPQQHAEGGCGLCSPEIHYMRDTFWISYGLRQGGTGLLRSSSGSIEGPYLDMGRMSEDGHDASLFEDEDGAVYWVYGNGKIARMQDDMAGLAELPRLAQVQPWWSAGREDHPAYSRNSQIGSHGASVIKRDGYYFLFGADALKRMDSDAIDTFAAVSQAIYGPYSRRYLAIPHGGQAALFTGHDQQLYASFSGCGSYSPVERMPAAVPMTMAGPGFIRPSEDALLEKGAVGSLKPAADFRIRDPHISTGPDGTYYLTGTSNEPHGNFWDRNNQLHVWSSPDLKEWRHVAKVWDLAVNGTWENNIYEHPCLWAPEMIYLHGTFWITYSLKGGGTGLIKSVSGQAEGPYIDMGRMTNTDIDSSLFQDDDGQVYFVWQDGMIARMKDNMTGFAEMPRKLLCSDGQRVGYEGAFIVKYKGKYVLGAAEWNGDKRVDGTYDLMYAVADHLYGPYTPRRLAVPHGGHGTMFIDREGKLRSTLFGNDRTAPFRTLLGIVPLEAEADEQGMRIDPCAE